MKINYKLKWVVIMEAAVQRSATRNGVQGIIFCDLFIQLEWTHPWAVLIMFDTSNNEQLKLSDQTSRWCNYNNWIYSIYKNCFILVQFPKKRSLHSYQWKLRSIVLFTAFRHTWFMIPNLRWCGISTININFLQ